MQKVKNIKCYDDDLEIIGVLQKLPKSEDFENKNILKFIEENTKGKDFGAVIPVKDEIYVLYKFDKDLISEKDAGLILSISKKEFINEQIELWNSFKTVGMSFSKNIFSGIIESLIAFQAVNIFKS